MKNLFFLYTFILSTFSLSAQTTYQASDILTMVGKGQEVNISNATILGNLDFTQIEKKDKGGRYGVRGGIAQEYFTRVTAPVRFNNCVFEGSVITQSEIWVKKIRKENFTSFNAPVTFQNCAFNEDVNIESIRIQKTVTIQNCTFERALKFKHAHFEKPPIFEGNTIRGKFTNAHTNWDKAQSEIEKPAPKPTDLVYVILKNSTLSKIDIRFGNEKWSLSPLGKSSLERKAGTEIYLIEKGRDRLILTLNESMNQSTFDVAKL